ncbi:hypothetical protein SteCoe_15205 [Stentor coeruleus]|uniref:C2H2-type domain-containing protein n=1 Tax=Stentor coeruleus TaxID=5963 RepID=A0A1R2C459_9CILI|nr:hypothetical protein SteCoe_15205 [Stentor coeruleus]
MKTSYISCKVPKCKRTFRNEKSMEKHLNEDHSDCDNNELVGYRCRKCKRVLGTKQCLKEHLYTHTGQKPYKCLEPGCGKNFRQSSQLSYHKKVHSELKKYFLKNTGGILIETGSQDQNEISKESPLDLLKLPGINGPQYGVKLPSMFS